MRKRSDSLTIREKSKSNGDPQETQREWPSPNAVKMLMVNAHLHQRTRNEMDAFGCSAKSSKSLVHDKTFF